VVSLEAIVLSTFVMIGQNRQAAFQKAKADHDFEAQELELKTNNDLTRQIHLTEELHRRLIDGSASSPRYCAAADSWPRRLVGSTRQQLSAPSEPLTACLRPVPQQRYHTWTAYTSEQTPSRSGNRCASRRRCRIGCESGDFAGDNLGVKWGASYRQPYVTVTNYPVAQGY
jgi:hypothetical protein